MNTINRCRLCISVLLNSMQILSVSEAVKNISDYLEMGLGSIAIQGEVVGYNVNQNRLVFFELKDENSRILCFALTHEITETLEDGMEIKILGTPKLFKKTGKLHIKVQEVELIGAGALQKAFEQLKKKLSIEGIFEDKHKQALPRFPQSIGLLTSRDAAAYNDVMIRLNERWGGLEIKFAHTGVQGLGAVTQIVKAIEYVNQHEPVEVMILTRGGGSLEDLQAFNDEKVVRAVFASKIPIVVGIGHERDVTLADLAADARASTPTNAAELVVPHRREIEFQIKQMQESIVETVLGEIKNKKQVAVQLVERVSIWLQRIQEKIEHQVKLLTTLSPQATLERGYSITFKAGQPITDVKMVKKSDIIKTKLAKGDFESQVN